MSTLVPGEEGEIVKRCVDYQLTLFARCPEYCLFRFHFVSVFFGVNSRSNLSELLRPHTEQRVFFQQLTDPSNHGIYSQWHALPTFRGLLDLVFAQAGVTITNNLQADLTTLGGTAFANLNVAARDYLGMLAQNMRDKADWSITSKLVTPPENSPNNRPRPGGDRGGDRGGGGAGMPVVGS